MKTYQFGQTVLGLPIMAYTFNSPSVGQGAPEVLVLGGVHGNEPEGVVAALGLLRRYLEVFDLRLSLTLVPSLNQDGVLAFRRTNTHLVDLNRNLPTRDWTSAAAKPDYAPGPYANSEPENQALVQWMTTHKPRFIISLHSWKPLININGDCRREAEAIRARTGYEITEDIGYPTPGCLGTYAWSDHGIPTITYEIERGLSQDRIVEIHVPAIDEALQTFASQQEIKKL
jgi:murein peptide amidase A